MSRLITGLIALPILIASIWIRFLSPLFVAIVAAAIALGLYEFWLLAKRREMQPDIVIGMSMAAAVFVSFLLNVPEYLLFVVPALTIAAMSAEMLRGAPFEKMIGSVGSTLLGVLYVGVLGSHLVGARVVGDPFGYPELGSKLLSFLLIVIMGSDTAAYYTGRTFGKHKLAPSVSPGKTWEGAIGGMVASIVGAIIAHYWFFQDLSLKVAIPLAIVMNILGVVGDLTESALKRGSGAKDAAQLLPGHGGILDRLDSLLFNAPLIYYLGRVHLS
jgi:phosphatidate cytidylyltransferase